MDDPVIQYIESLEKQCDKWEKMYLDVRNERDQLKKKLDIAMSSSNEITSKTKQLRHV